MLDPARLVPTMCHHKLPTTMYCDLTNTQQLFDIPFSLQGLKCMQLAHAHPTISYIHLVI